ncbi:MULTISPECIES: SPOR domain-containing protein [Streptomyces]|uniref:Sporulation related domain-containing protein n=1 Tax=Streptomyces aidingensis TaxID=910347 RepID=A0A1I1ESM0_9ACTN|nr:MULTISPECIES: SPOR domain-containing protein [Streptomyces]SFB90115.1 Sporulation related domain-containing protein [Streptomyces aidingensis]
MNNRNPRPWQVVRQDQNGNRYRIGHCATRAEAQRLIRRLEAAAGARPAGWGRYLVERVEQRNSTLR